MNRGGIGKVYTCYQGLNLETLIDWLKCIFVRTSNLYL